MPEKKVCKTDGCFKRIPTRNIIDGQVRRGLDTAAALHMEAMSNDLCVSCFNKLKEKSAQ